MKRQSCMALILAFGLVFIGGLSVVQADEAIDQLVNDANESIAIAAAEVEEARIAIENGKQLMTQIPTDSELIGEVKQMLFEVSKEWELAINALEGAKQGASKIVSASNEEIARDYKLLATVNSGVALAGAKVVQTGLLFVDAVANNKTESLDIIRMAMQDSLAATSQVRFNYERVKALIAEKYSK